MKMLPFVQLAMIVLFWLFIWLGLDAAPRWVICFAAAAWSYYVGVKYLGMSGVWD